MNSCGSAGEEVIGCCPLCSLTATAVLRFRRSGYCIYSCKNCSLLFVYPRPSPQNLMEIYSPDYFCRGSKYLIEGDMAAMELPDPNDLFKVELLRRYKAGSSVLDVGCATGGFLKCAEQAGYQVMGVEVSAFAAQKAATKGLKIMNCDLPAAGLPTGQYDAVTLWDVIEHLDNPLPTLTEVYRLLRPGGVLFLTTGDAGSRWAKIAGRYWQLLTPPQHLYFYNLRSLGKALELSGFFLKDVWRYGKSVPVDLILLKACEAVGPVVAPLSFLARNFGLTTKRVNINLRDILTCVAVRAC